MRTTKISIAIDKSQLLRARAAAESEGVSLSRYIATALQKQLEDQDRIEAARRLAATWGPESAPTAEDRAAFRALMSRPRKRRGRAA
jgi:hypothetical protein